ncbi:Alcohol dehydrogenase 1 [Colletotrichum spinosum]|uniref:Alcohol dehydrogenase 1 n=1 Tax=Colletotrichum spinosum TaxID=1347390 RepID=A0A4R8QBC7_9PEZI|nr:Alcohol dehydrogenase 1 [Colletotrichum spinosum]
MGSATTNYALKLTAFGAPLTKIELPIPEATTGTVVTRVLAAPVVPYTHLAHAGLLPQLGLEPPLIPNSAGIGRVHAVGPDAVRLKPGDLVYVKAQVQARDDPNTKIVIGHIGADNPRARKLMQGEWKDGAFQQYQKVPLENCYALDENRLCKELGYTPAVLQSLTMYAISAGAVIEGADIKASETIIIGPSGGTFGGLAVEIALAIGANVIALGRNEEKLAAMQKKINNPRLQYVIMTGDEEADMKAILDKTPDGEGAEVYNDWTPGELPQPLYLGAASRVLKLGGRVVLSGGTMGGLGAINYAEAVFKDLHIIAKWVCHRRTLELLLRMITQGLLRIGVESGTVTKEFNLDQVEEAKEYAKNFGGWRHYVSMVP